MVGMSQTFTTRVVLAVVLVGTTQMGSGVSSATTEESTSVSQATSPSRAGTLRHVRSTHLPQAQRYGQQTRKDELARFDKDQCEGIAKIADNLATAGMVAAIVGGFVDHKIGWATVLRLVTSVGVLAFIGIVMRKDGSHGN